MQDRLLRSRTDRVIGGVCGGLAHYFDLDPVIVRLIFVLLVMGGGIGFLLYIILWAIIPSERAPTYGLNPGVFPPPSQGALQHNHQPDQWTSSSAAPFDPATFRYDPYTGKPISPTVYPRVGDVAQPERGPATGQTIDLRREADARPSVAETPVPPPVPVPPPTPPYLPPVNTDRLKQSTDRKPQLGIILLVVGALILASEFGIGEFFFPALLIIGGFLLLTRR